MSDLPPSTPVAPPEQAPLLSEGEEAVLLVDDEAPIRRVLKRLLTGRNVGYKGKVLEAANGDEGVALLRQFGERIRLMITDFNMPSNAQGNEVARVAHEVGVQAIAVITARPENLETIAVPALRLDKPFDNGKVEQWMRENLFPAAPPAQEPSVTPDPTTAQ